MNKMCVPFDDEDLIHGAGQFRVGGVAPEVVTPGAGTLSDLGRDDILYVLAHGRYSSGSEIVGIVKGHLWGTRRSTMKAADLAEFLRGKGLPTSFGDLRLLVCWGGYVGDSVTDGGHTLKRSSEQAPFAGQLCSVLKDKFGFTRIRVTGYRGMVSYVGKGKKTTISTVMVDLPGSSMVMDDFGVALKNNKATGNTFTLDNKSRTVWY